MISSTWTVFWYLFTATISLDSETVESPREREAIPDSSSASILVISSRSRAASLSVTAFASFLKALPRGPLLGTISVTSLVTGAGSFFSAHRRSPVSTANALHPAIAGEQPGVPAIAGVVRDLVPHVLPELEPGRVHADLEQEHLDPGHKVTQGLIGHKSN